MQVEESDRRWRGAIAEGGEELQAEGRDRRRRRAIVDGSDRWRRKAIAGGGERS